MSSSAEDEDDTGEHEDELETVAGDWELQTESDTDTTSHNSPGKH